MSPDIRGERDMTDPDTGASAGPGPGTAGGSSAGGGPSPGSGPSAGGGPVRVRFPPSPTGDLHVGNIRSALFNWAFARHTGGVFILRIEDTDRARNTEESYRGVLDDLRWLGLTWDEGPDIGGPHAPYRQSERGEIYADVARRLHEVGAAYHCYCTPAEVEARNKAAGRPPGYDGHCRQLTDEQVAAYQADGRAPVLRLRMPGVPIVFDDLIRGEVRFAPEHVPDYVLVRADGFPLYPLVNPVDDALMGVTHVLRGEDLLSSTPRQLALYDALRAAGLFTGTTPLFGHLPFVVGEGNQKLSKRKTPEVSLAYCRERGILPEALLNYLALLGWSIGEDRELFSLDEMVEAFTLDRVSRNPARFDPKKLQMINGVKIRELPAGELVHRITPFLRAAGLLADPPTTEQLALLAAAVPLVQERIELLGFLLVDDAAFTVDPDAAERQLGPAAAPVLSATVAALEPLPEWTAASIEAALRAALVDGLGLKPKNAFGPVRVAITGRTVSPPLFESLELLGRDRALHRLNAALTRLAAPTG
jgi:glutamyl-tRNA synthetase